MSVSKAPLLLSSEKLPDYSFSANSFRGNYSFLTLINLMYCDQYIQVHTIQGRKLFAEIRYNKNVLINPVKSFLGGVGEYYRLEPGGHI